MFSFIVIRPSRKVADKEDGFQFPEEDFHALHGIAGFRGKNMKGRFVGEKILGITFHDFSIHEPAYDFYLFHGFAFPFSKPRIDRGGDFLLFISVHKSIL
jgi:hypothetical protein